MTVYIPTLGRPENMPKIIPRWLEQNMPIRLVVIPEEFDDYDSLRRRNGWNVEISRLPSRVYGIGATRRWCVLHAQRHSLPSIIFSDDDLRPAKDADFSKLLDAAQDPRVLGICAVRSIHDRFILRSIPQEKGIIICAGSWGHQLFALNVANTIRVGNFESCFYSSCEDGELHRKGIAAGFPWLAHCGVRGEQVGNTYAEGGISALFGSQDERMAAEEVQISIVRERWPEFAFAPGKRPHMKWPKMMDRYIPGWRERSILHGGTLNWDGSPKK